MKLRFVGYAALAVFCAGAIGYAQTTSTTGAPSITPGGIANATGYQTTLAPGVVFVIFGNNLGPATIQGASLPYPQNLVGTSISFTPAAGGAAIPANLIYTSAAVVAGFLPSSATPGTYSVRVTYNLQTSPPQNVTVAQRSFGIGTSNSGGTGEAQATLANVNNGLSLIRFTTGSVNSDGYNFELTPAHPGDTVVLWGTGGGADPANDAGGTSGDQTAAGNFMVTVDGTQITPLYAGAVTGYPGLWQINFVLPTSMPADCFASVQVTAGGQTGNSATLAIAAPGQTSCSSQINTTTFDSLENGGNITFAGLTIAGVVYYSGGTVQNSTIAGGVFNQYTAAAFLIDYSGAKIGGCTVVQETTPTGGKEPSGPNALLDAGTLTLSGPGVPSQTMPVTVGPLGPAYSASLAAGALENGGTYTLTGSGGKQVGPFTATATMPVSFTSNLSTLSSVSHAQPLTITWSGSGFDQALILIIGDTTTSSGTLSTTVSCVEPAALGTFAIPAAALAALPSGGTWQIEITAAPYQGGVASAESATSTALTPPLVGGGQVDFGAFTPGILHVVTATVH